MHGQHAWDNAAHRLPGGIRMWAPATSLTAEQEVVHAACGCARLQCFTSASLLGKGSVWSWDTAAGTAAPARWCEALSVVLCRGCVVCAHGRIAWIAFCPKHEQQSSLLKVVLTF